MSRFRRVLTCMVQTRVGGDLVLRPVVSVGYRRFARTGWTPPIAYSAMRKLFGSPAAGVLDDLAARERDRNPKLEWSTTGLVSAEIGEAITNLERDGLHVFAARLPEEMCAALENLATRTPATLVAGLPDAPARAIFDPRHPLAPRYDLDEDDLLADATVQDLLADSSMLELAQEYLGSAPIQDLVAMWWTAPLGTTASSEAAQRFHFDLDRLRFVKLFVYLTDVDLQSGPHVYVKGSHRALPLVLRADRRLDDEEVASMFPAEAFVEVTGKRGTMFAADTRGLHKGLPARERHRLVFQMEWASSLFGQPIATRRLAIVSGRLRRMLESHPTVYRRFSAAP
jgi:hypothetical protein